ncbi:MAG: hypothetical protein AAF548_01165 [Actinomycetota bacterium]
MSTATAVIVSAHLLATVAMGGLIWFVQVVHYPLFAAVGDNRFVAYEHDHTRRTAWVVGPFMAVEGVTALVLLGSPIEGVRLLAFVGAALLAAVHASTVLLQVPAHRRLSSEADPTVMRRLVATNWIRTVGWSARSVVAMAIVLEAAS